MKRSAPYLSDSALVRDLSAAVVQEGIGTARVLDHIAEFDARRLYLPAAYSSTYTYCVGHLHLSEDAAYKRIQAARVAARFPAIFCAVAEGRLHLSGVCLLAPHLTEDTAAELLAAAERKSKAEIERLLAHRFPRPDLPDLMTAITTPVTAGQLAPGQVGETPSTPERACGEPQPFSGNEAPPAAPPQLAPAPPDRLTVKPLAPGRFALQGTIDQATHDKLRYAQELLSHQISSGDLGQVLAKLLDLGLPQLERDKFAAAATPRATAHRPTRNLRHIPAEVMRTVWARDGGRCTFVSDSGRRCTARTFIEFDHVLEVARGGEATIDGIRLLCHAHNQHQAERTFGSEFMRHKRRAAAEARAGARARAAAMARESCIFARDDRPSADRRRE